MSILKKFLLTSRYHKPHGILLLFFPCIWGMNLTNNNITEEIFLYIIFFIGACGMRSLGCIWNDYNDKHLDINVIRTKERLIATGEVNNKNIIFFSFINSLIGSLPLYFLPMHSLLLSLSVIPLIVIYPFMKRFTWWPQLWLGLSFNWGILVGYSVFNNILFSLEVLLFYLGSIVFTIGYDTIYGFQDIKDDEIIGIKSTSIKYRNKPKLFLCCVYLIAFSFWFLSLILLNKSILSLSLFLVFYILLTVKVLFTNIKNPIECKITFNTNSYFCFFFTLILVFS